jgi:hypothetical protein
VNDRIHAGIATLSACFIVAAFAVRWAVTPVRKRGRHRGRPVQAVADDALLAELTEDWPEPATGAVVAQAWRWCADCMRMEPALLHADDCWRCGHCLTATYAGTEAAS